MKGLSFFFSSLYIFLLTMNNIEPSAEDKQKNKDVATRIVQEEKERKNVLPQYPGLERFEIIEKIGE